MNFNSFKFRNDYRTKILGEAKADLSADCEKTVESREKISE